MVQISPLSSPNCSSSLTLTQSLSLPCRQRLPISLRITSTLSRGGQCPFCLALADLRTAMSPLSCPNFLSPTHADLLADPQTRQVPTYLQESDVSSTGASPPSDLCLLIFQVSTPLPPHKHIRTPSATPIVHITRV